MSEAEHADEPLVSDHAKADETEQTGGRGTGTQGSSTVAGLNEVEDSAPKFGYEEVQEARFAHGDLDAEQIGVSLQRVKPGKRHAFAHRHKEAEEIYFVVSGSGRVKLDGQVEEVGVKPVQDNPLRQ